MNRTFEEQRTAAEKIEDAEVKARVLKGLEVLREQYGEDWVEHIDVADLDLSSASRCILGQLEPLKGNEDDHYSEALTRINADVAVHPDAYGFDSSEMATYTELTEAWVIVAGLEDERDAAAAEWM